MRRGKPDRRVGKGALASARHSSPKLTSRRDAVGGHAIGRAFAPPVRFAHPTRSERRARLRLFLSRSGRFGLARQRNDTQRGDAIALAAQYAKAEAVEG